MALSPSLSPFPPSRFLSFPLHILRPVAATNNVLNLMKDFDYKCHYICSQPIKWVVLCKGGGGLGSRFRVVPHVNLACKTMLFLVTRFFMCVFRLKNWLRPHSPVNYIDTSYRLLAANLQMTKSIYKRAISWHVGRTNSAIWEVNSSP